jgi:hypothetical protein
MSSNYESPDDTLQKLLSRRAKLNTSYNVTDALTVDELAKVRQSALSSQAAQQQAPKRPAEGRGRGYWFGHR